MTSPPSQSSARRFRWVALACLAAGALGPLFAAVPQAPPVLHLKLRSIVHPIAAEFVTDAVAQADAESAAALVIELDTPGGLMTSMREITTALLSARTPVVVYVSPSGAQAASAGFFLLMAADVAAMAPGTNTGAAHPVGPQGESLEGTMGEKVEQDAAATIRSLAARNGRDAKLAEAAVVESRSFTADEALAGKLIDLIAPSLPELLKQLDGRTVKRGAATVALATAGAPVREIEMSRLRALLANLAHPNVAYVLLTLGTLGLFFELSNPGAVLPGVVGAICLVLAFYALSVLPVNVAGVALLGLALLFFIAEIKVTSYGLLTVAGLVSLVLGSLLLFKRSEPAIRVSLALIGSLTAFTALVVGFLVWMVLRARRNPVRTGLAGMLQETGTARTALEPQGPKGKVFVHGEIWDAVAAEPVTAGETVEVVAVENFTLTVRRK